MIGPGTGVRVYLACGVTDMRKGIAGLSALAQDGLRQDPASGAVFAFRGRSGDRLKLLYWDGEPSWRHRFEPDGERVLPLLQGPGARALSMARRQGRRDPEMRFSALVGPTRLPSEDRWDAADQRTARHALGGHGLATSDLGRAACAGRLMSA